MKSKNKRMATIVVLAVVAFGFYSCNKEKVTPPMVKLFEGAITINYTSASVSAEITDQGGAEVLARGFAYGKSSEVMDTIFCGSGMGVYSGDLNNLEPNTTYVYEAFARNIGGMGTSGKVTFTTRDHDAPTVKTGEVESIGITSASCSGNVTFDGGAAVTERGICWSTSHSPAINDSHSTSGSGTGIYTCNMSNLTGNMTYYVRAYAKNSKGVGYGEEKSFTTLDYNLPAVTTANVTEVTQTSAKCGGDVTSDGGGTVTERGVCWSISHNPTISDSHTASGTGTGNFTSDITGLSAHTTYYVRAYATNSKGTAYGEEKEFSTSAYKPTVFTGGTSNVTTTSATGSGNVTFDGGSPVTERGLCWSTNHEPTIGGLHIAAGTGTGEFTVSMTHLSANTTYYVRAYATNSVGTSYGDEVAFTTLSISVPGVTTATVTNIGQNTATGGGNVISDGGANVTERGICWSTNHNPIISGSHASGGTGIGEFIVNMTNLTTNTTYYVRAYAINSQGIAYGNEVEFKTSLIPNYTVNVSANPTNGGSVTGSGTYQQGQSCTVRAIAATGYTFIKWTEGGTQISTNANYTFNVTGNRTLVAHFEQRYTVTVHAYPSSAGSVSGGGTYDYGASCTVMATPNSGYVFTDWKVNGQVVSYNANYTFQVSGNIILVAYFSAAQTPSVTTNEVTSITQTTAVCGGFVSNAGGGTVTARGVCWSTSPNPTISNLHTTDGSGIGSFTSSITGLMAGTTYYVRAYATNSAGTGYGTQKVFTTSGNGSSFYIDFENGFPSGWTTIDADSDGYNWVLGSQVGGIYLVAGSSLAGTGHNNSSDLIVSGSYSNVTAQPIVPDNYLVSPSVNLTNNSTFSFYACAQDAAYAAEHFGVFVSTNGTNPSNFIMVQEWTMTAKCNTKSTRGMNVQGNWYYYTVSLGAYAGSNRRIAIRHFNCNDMFILNVDDISLANGSKDESKTWNLFNPTNSIESIQYGKVSVANCITCSLDIANDLNYVRKDSPRDYLMNKRKRSRKSRHYMIHERLDMESL